MMSRRSGSRVHPGKIKVGTVFCGPAGARSSSGVVRVSWVRPALSRSKQPPCSPCRIFAAALCAILWWRTVWHCLMVGCAHGPRVWYPVSGPPPQSRQLRAPGVSGIILMVTFRLWPKKHPYRHSSTFFRLFFHRRPLPRMCSRSCDSVVKPQCGSFAASARFLPACVEALVVISLVQCNSILARVAASRVSGAIVLGGSSALSLFVSFCCSSVCGGRQT
jgi:hypothetical protein